MVEDILKGIGNRHLPPVCGHLLIAMLLSIAFFINCTSGLKKPSTLGTAGASTGLPSGDMTKTSPGTASKNNSAGTGSAATADASAADTVLENPEVLIETAKQACDSGNYASADSSLRRAVKSIENLDADNTDDEEWLPASRYLDDIVAVYTSKMPPPYTVPDDITMLAFQKQMVRSLDSLKFMPSDSLRIATMGCQKGLSYDVPMLWNERVQRALFFYMNNRSSTVDKWFSRASYYLPVMRKMFADSGLPLDLAYLPLIESGFNPLAYSYAHASGIWQFISSTGKLYGLRHNYWLDERRDPLKATQAAISYLKKLYGDFSNWHLALAAYNCGENGVGRCIKRHKTNDFWKLPLPNQTKSYVPFYLAAVTIAKNPKCFNVVMPPSDTFALDTVQLNTSIVLNDIADGLGVPLDTLKKINPHILRWCTPPDDSNTVLYLPKGQKQAFVDFYLKLPEEKKVKWCRYRVKPGDNIQRIALQYNITVDCITAVNHLQKNRLENDKALFLPMPCGTATTTVAYIPPETHDDDDFSDMTTYRVRKGDNLGKIARRYRVSVAQLRRLNRLSSSSILRIGRVLVVRRPSVIPSSPAPVLAVIAAPAATADTTKPAGVHVVKPGETLFAIAQQNKTTITDLAALNNLDEKQPIIHTGDTLKLEKESAAIVLRDSSIKAPIEPTLPDSSTSSAIVQARLDSSAARGTQVQPESQTDSTTPLAGNSAALPDDLKPVVPDSAGQAPATPVSRNNPKIAPPAPFYYKIKKGDNLFRVSLAFSIPLPILLTANHLTRNSVVHVGDSVLIPGVSKTGIPDRTSIEPNQKIVFYKVKSGDTFWRIAESFGVSIEEIYQQNNLKPDSVLVPGKVIKVIKAGSM